MRSDQSCMHVCFAFTVSLVLQGVLAISLGHVEDAHAEDTAASGVLKQKQALVIDAKSAASKKEGGAGPGVAELETFCMDPKTTLEKCQKRAKRVSNKPQKVTEAPGKKAHAKKEPSEAGAENGAERAARKAKKQQNKAADA